MTSTQSHHRIPLEIPSGVVPLGSPFYVRRNADGKLEQQIGGSGTITTIRGARQMGKTSLLVRGIDYARSLGTRVIHLDLQQIFDASQLGDIHQFLQFFTYAIAHQVGANLSDVDSIWQRPFAVKHKATLFLERFILDMVDTPVLLIMDETDLLLPASFSSDFFGLLRSWHNKCASDPPWKKLNIVMAISTHPALLIQDLRQSPFNVGVPIELDDFVQSQVWDLNNRHGGPLQPHEISEAMEWLGGNPYLVRQALYTLVSEGMSWPELAAVATQEEGPFGGHLRYHLGLLHDDPELMKEMRSVVTEGKCPPDQVLLRLCSAGLIQIKDTHCACRCGLYERFFRTHLAGTTSLA